MDDMVRRFPEVTDNMNSKRNSGSRCWPAVAVLYLLAACAQPYAVSINNQAVYDPTGRLPDVDTIDADLQGCINLALRQQRLTNAAELTVLSCANSAIRRLENIGQLRQLRFLDLSNNQIVNITPLEELPVLSGLSLTNNRIIDIAPLLNLPALSSVSLTGNNGIPCQQLRQLASHLPGNLNAPQSCQDGAVSRQFR